MGDCGANGSGRMCVVIEGEGSYDHKLTREQLCVPFVAHAVFEEKKLVHQHTFSNMELVTRFLDQCERFLWTPLIQMRLYAAAAHGLLDSGDVESEFDTAVLTGDTEASVIDRICTKQGVTYAQSQWAYNAGF